jgi:photoactive yellow protein
MNQPIELPEFGAADLSVRLSSLPGEMLDALPYGAIRIDADGVVTTYNATEARLSGYPGQPLGRHFFTQVAPCMDTPQYRGRLQAGLATGRLDLAFGWVGDFSDRERELDVRVIGTPGGGAWIVMRRV